MTVEESDDLCWDMLRHSGPLVKFVGDVDDGIVAASADPTMRTTRVIIDEAMATHSSSVPNGDANCQRPTIINSPNCIPSKITCHAYIIPS